MNARDRLWQTLTGGSSPQVTLGCIPIGAHATALEDRKFRSTCTLIPLAISVHISQHNKHIACFLPCSCDDGCEGYHAHDKRYICLALVSRLGAAHAHSSPPAWQTMLKWVQISNITGRTYALFIGQSPPKSCTSPGVQICEVRLKLNESPFRGAPHTFKSRTELLHRAFIIPVHFDHQDHGNCLGKCGFPCLCATTFPNLSNSSAKIAPCIG